jgi:hypothetical protein
MTPADRPDPREMTGRATGLPRRVRTGIGDPDMGQSPALAAAAGPRLARCSGEPP